MDWEDECLEEDFEGEEFDYLPTGEHGEEWPAYDGSDEDTEEDERRDFEDMVELSEEEAAAAPTLNGLAPIYYDPYERDYLYPPPEEDNPDAIELRLT